MEITNKLLLDEIILCKEKKQYSDEIKEIFLQLVRRELSKSKYKQLSDDNKIACESLAFEACCNTIFKYDVNSKYLPISCIETIIRGSFCDSIVKIQRKDIL